MVVDSGDRGLTRHELETRRAYQQRLTLDPSTNKLRASAQDGRTQPGQPRSKRRLNLIVIGSGSKGNASVVYDRITGDGILIDAGICKRDVFSFSEQGGFDLSNLKGIFISHSHSDHVKNLGVVLRGLRSVGIDVPLFMHQDTLASSKELQKAQAGQKVVFIESGDAVEAGSLAVLPLPTSHDADVSFGFRIECGEDALGFVTDTGIMLPETLAALQGVRILGLESNHDETMLRTGPYPRMLKQRVASDRGHLSNHQAAEALRSLITDQLETVVALHISENNNTYRLPVDTLRAVVEGAHANVQVTCAYQHRPVFITS